jgi:oligopeptide transport system substrate-binding protein
MGSCLAYLTTLILAVTVFGCQSSSQKNLSQLNARAVKTELNPRTVKINIGDEPQTLDPRKARDLNCQTIARMLFEGLTRVNVLEKAELALAESVTISADLKTYTFRLKNSVWSNGDPVKASDFIYAWKKVLSPDFPSDTAFNLYPIKNAKIAKEGKLKVDDIGVLALDDQTLVVALECPTPYFLDLIACPAYFPVNQKVDEKNSSWFQNAADYVGNGPFQLVEWKHQDHLALKKNGKYWDAACVKINSLELLMLQGETELKLFEKKDLDWAGSPLSTLPLEALQSLKNDSNFKTKELLGTYFIRTNTERAPFNHSLMRKAFALAINRRAIVDHVTQGNQIPATGLVPISLELQRQPYFRDGDLKRARALFSEALSTLELKKEELPDICLMYRAGERNHLIAQAVQQQWFEAFGVSIKLESIEGKIYFDKLSKQNYQMAFGDWIADFADPINFLEVFKYKKGGSNNTLWENARFIELLDQSSQESDFAKRCEILAQSEQILIEQMPIIPIFYYSMLYVNQPTLKDVVLSSMGQIDFKWASVENDAKAIAQGDAK